MEAMEGILRDALRKLEDQSKIVRALQADVTSQKDRIDKQEKVITELSAKVEELNLKMQSKDDYTNTIWKDTENLSLADAVKDTAEKTLMANSGFVYDPQTKLYCNYSTGYYYDPAQKLYYNGHTGTYYTYDEDKQEYIVHSQVQLESQNPKKAGKRQKTKKPSTNAASESTARDSRKVTSRRSTSDEKTCLDDATQRTRLVETTKKEKPKKLTNEEMDDFEEGELDTSSDDNAEDNMGDGGPECSSNSEEYSSDDVSHEEHAPCIRAIILESSSREIKKGSLFLITCLGGTIGSEGLEHAITLSDPHIEKTHAQIAYKYLELSLEQSESSHRKTKKYYIYDVGSKHGTFLNGSRLSEPHETSAPFEILHGSIVKVGDFSILLHIHPGSFTCGHCEPGLLLETETQATSNNGDQNQKGKSRNAMIKQIKKKYGIQHSLNPGQLPDADGYVDRAYKRRVVKGSDNPFEKTQVATLDQSISETNKGFKMLAKMGWSAGKSLGNPESKGLLEPIMPSLKSDRSGLGQTNPFLPIVKVEDGKKPKKVFPKSKQSRAEQLAITMKRFKEAGQTEIDVGDENPP